MTDVTTVEARTLRVTILDIAYLSTMPTGVALGICTFTFIIIIIIIIIISVIIIIIIIIIIIHTTTTTTI
jgi:PCFT/HCP family folate transporter-like MFS transporter 1/3